MASTSSRIRIIFDAAVEGLVRGARTAEERLEKFRDETDKLDKGLSRIFTSSTKAVLGLGSIANTLPVFAGIATSATTAAGALLVLPAAGLGAAAAITTLKIATSGFGDAVSAADPKAFAEATANMAPSMKDAAGAVRELVQGPLADLKRDVQGAFWVDFSDDVIDLSRTFLPVLSPQLVGIAAAYAGMRKEAVGALIAPAAVRDVNAVLGDTRGVLDDMRPALANVLDGILAIAGQGSAEFRGFGQSVTDVTTRFREWAREAAATGRITEIIREGKQELDDYGQIAGNVGDIVSTIFAGLTRDTGDFSEGLIEGTQALEDFLDSAEGQDALAALGQTLQVTGEVARTVFLAAIRELGPIIREAAPAAQEFARVLGGLLVAAIQTVGPLIQAFASFLSDNAGIIQFTVPLLAALVLGFSALKVVAAVAGFITSAAAAIRLLGVAAGPIGLLIVGAATALAVFASRNQESAAAARENQEAIDGLKGTLNQLTGAATGATQAQIAQDLVSKKLADGTTLLRDALGRAGISLADFTEAATGSPAAIAAVDAQLSAVARTLPGVRDLFDQNRLGLDAIGLSFDEFAGFVSRGSAGYAELNARVLELGGTFQFTEGSVKAAAGELGEVGNEFARLRGQVQEAGEQVRVAAQAGQDFTVVLEAIGAGFSSLANGAAPTRLMRDNLQALAVSARDAAVAAGDAALAAGGDLAGAAREGAAAMLESRNAFISAAEAAGVARPQAIALADSLGLIPSVVETQILLDAEGVNGELLTISAQLAAVPGNKEITVNTLTAEATVKLQSLGFTVTNLPNGQIKITATDDEARGRLTDIIATIGATVGTFDLDANPDPANGVITSTLTFVDGSTGTLTIDANGAPATIELNGQLGRIDAATGVLTIDGDPNPANAKLNGQIVSIDRATGTLRILANDQAVIDAKNRAQQPTFSTHTIRVIRTGEVLGSGNTGLAGGGVVGWRAAGGLVVPGYGPGRDTFGPVWLSPGEAVLVPELAKRVGYRNILRENRRFSGGRQGQVLGDFGGLLAGGGVAGRAYLAGGGIVATAVSPSPVVNVSPARVGVTFIVDGKEFRGMMRAEIDDYDRASARRVRVGSGVTW